MYCRRDRYYNKHVTTTLQPVISTNLQLNTTNAAYELLETCSESEVNSLKIKIKEETSRLIFFNCKLSQKVIVDSDNLEILLESKCSSHSMSILISKILNDIQIYD